MNTCDDGHPEVVYVARECPVCDERNKRLEAEERVGDLEGRINDLKGELEDLNQKLCQAQESL